MDILNFLLLENNRCGLNIGTIVNYYDDKVLNSCLKGRKTKRLDQVMIPRRNGFYLVDGDCYQVSFKDGEMRIKKKWPSKINSCYEINWKGFKELFYIAKPLLKSRDGLTVDEFLENTKQLELITAAISILRPVLQTFPSLLGGITSALPGLPAAGVGGLFTGGAGLAASHLTFDMVFDFVQLLIMLIVSQAQLLANFTSLLMKNQNIKKIFDIILESKPDVNPERFRVKKLDDFFVQLGFDFNITQNQIISFQNGPDGIQNKMKVWACQNKEEMKVLQANCNIVNTTVNLLTSILSQIISVLVPGDYGIGSFVTKFGMDIGISLLPLLQVDVYEVAKKPFNLIPKQFKEKTTEPSKLVLPEHSGFLFDTERMNKLFLYLIVQFRDIIGKIFFSDFITKPNSNSVIEKARKKLEPYVNIAKHWIDFIDQFLTTNMIVFSNFVMIIQSSFWVFLWILSFCSKEINC